MTLFVIFMLLSYAATIYFMVHNIFFLALICFVANSCLTLFYILKLLHRQPDMPQGALSYTSASSDKPAYIEQASRTIARLQLANQKLEEENRKLERLIHEK